jgi:NitT/TauT family transport system permease protein
MNPRTLEKLSPWLFTIAIFLVWELACIVFKVNTSVLQPPSAAFAAMFKLWRVFLYHSWVTLWVTMVGFALAVGFGIILGLVVGWSRAIYRGLYPVMIGFNTIPKVAIVPLLILWFGIGEVPAIVTAFLISFFRSWSISPRVWRQPNRNSRTCCGRSAPASSTSCSRSAFRVRCHISSAR